MSNVNSIPMPTGSGFMNLTGQIFTRLTVKEYAGKSAQGHRWTCVCECGSTVMVTRHHLRSGHTRSCGCLRLEVHTTHGAYTTQEYKAWQSMWSRCRSEGHASYVKYQHRAPPESWREFEEFLRDVGPMPEPGLSLDRIDNEKPYGPDNCRWATAKVQQNNTSRNRLLTHDGVTLNVTQWAERLGLHHETLRSRIRAGWPAAMVLTEPTKNCGRRRLS